MYEVLKKCMMYDVVNIWCMMFLKMDTFIQGHDRKGKIVEKSDTTNPSSGKFNRTLLAIDI